MKKYRFALDTGDSLNITGVNYAGEAAIPYVAPAVLSAETITQNLIRVLPDIKYKANLQKVSGVTVQTAACDFAASADAVTLTDVVLEPTDLMVNYELCKADLRQTWAAAQTGSHLDSTLPADFQTFLLQYTALKVGEIVERNIWAGNYDADGSSAGTAAVTNFTGICKRLVDASGVGYEKNPAGAFTADNHATTGVLKHLDDMVANAPSQIQNNANAVIYMSRGTLFQLHRATSSLEAGQILVGGTARPTEWLGFPIITPAGFPPNTLIMTIPENLVFGTNALTDHTSATVVDMSKTDASDNVRVAMRFSGGTQIVHPGDVAFVSRAS